MTMPEMIIQLLTALLGSLGFAMFFGLKPRYYIEASLGGLIVWGLYLVGMHLFDHIFIACLLASALAALYSEVMARIMKAPATLFFITSVIPLIPGSTLYYACSNVISRQWEQASSYGSVTLQYALAIASGSSIVWSVFIMIERVRNNKKSEK